MQRRIYCDPATGYQSTVLLCKKASEEGLNVFRKAVKESLKSQNTYPKYKPIVRRQDYSQTYDNYIGEQVQMEHVEMDKYMRENGGMYWILTAIEILSRYAFAIPVYRKDTTNMTKDVTLLLKPFKDRFCYPKLAQFDDGKEFYNVGV